jgi:hypothetical protein
MERLYTSPRYGMWYPVDSKGLSSNLPPMVVFPDSTKFYMKWKGELESKNVKVGPGLHVQADAKIRLNTELVSVLRRAPTVRVILRPRRDQGDRHNPTFADQHLPETEEEFDEIVLCVLADTAKRVLGKEARMVEKWVLGNTSWSDDITITHSVSEGRQQ